MKSYSWNNKGHFSQNELGNKEAALYDILNTINSTFNRDALFKYIMQKIKKSLNVMGASIILWDQRGKKFFFHTVAEETEERENRLKQLCFPDNAGIASWVFHECTPLLVHDVRKDERFYKEIDESINSTTQSLLCVPLHIRGGRFGVLEAVNKKSGAFEKCDMPFLSALADCIAIALLKSQNQHLSQLRESAQPSYTFQDIIGKSDKIKNVLKNSQKVSQTSAPVLIYGESGTGKELIAQAIHNSSPRASGNFIDINCSAIPGSLLESELFGHEKGSFSSASARRIGLIEEAHNGTLFLDEIGDMPLLLQAKLLRILQEGKIRRIGSNANILVDVRLIAATHQDLARMVQEGKFRHDLYYRLKVFELKIPSLRERREDIPLLINHFIQLHSKRFGKEISGIESTARAILCDYTYPGNIRELEHIIEKAMILCESTVIGVGDLPMEMNNVRPSIIIPTACEDFINIPRTNEELKAAKAEARKRVEKELDVKFLKKILSRTNGNVTEAARLANMDRTYIYQLTNKYKIHINQIRKNIT
ncbi:MAG: sigma 54-interacting transcriptional regulator [bacterium]